MCVRAQDEPTGRNYQAAKGTPLLSAHNDCLLVCVGVSGQRRLTVPASQ
jgi:hypothetical protein